jgi:PAS domain S-box-containing protein
MSTPIRVLILEDQAADAELMLHGLRKAGFDPDWQRVEAEPEYLAALEKNPDLILADWSLPQFSGRRALQLMNERGLDIPFIIVSGSIGEEAAIEAIRQGANDYLLKDRPVRLGQAVRLALKNKQLREERKQEETRLITSEELHRTILETALDGFWLLNMQGHLLEVNEAYCRMSGYSKQELLQRHVTDLESIETASETATHIQKILTQGNDRFESRHRGKDGSIFEIEISVLYRPDKGGQMVAFLRDITARKRAEEALRNSERQYRDLIEFLPISIFELDAAGQLVTFNQTALQIFGYDEKEYREEMNTLQFFLPEERQRVVENFGKVIQGISTPGQEYIMLRKDGSTFSGLVYASSIIHENRTARIRGAIIDITERKRAAEELIKSEAKFRAIFDNASTGMFILDLQAQKFFMCNSTCAKMLGYAKEEFLKLDIADIHPREDMPFINEQIGKFSRGEEGIRSDIKFKRKNGSIFAVDLNPALLIIATRNIY